MSLQGPNLTPPELTSGIDHTDALETWSTWISSLGGSDDHSAPPPPLPDSILPTVTLADFGRYLASIGRKLDSYQGTFKESGVRISSSQSDASPMTTESSSGLAQAMTEVPLLFFREDFDLDSSEVWKHVGAIDSQMKHQEAMDQLSLQLDTAETQLTHEIADRYESFFEASIYVQELHGHVEQLLQAVAQTRSETKLISEEGSNGAERATTLTRKRENLLSTMHLCMAVQQVSHAKTALDNSIAAVPHAGLDYAGALDLLAGVDESRSQVPANLKSFGSLPEYVKEVKSAIKEIMIADLLERSKFDDTEMIAGMLEGLAGGRQVAVADYKHISEDSNLLAMSPAVAGLNRLGAMQEGLQALYKSIRLSMTSFITSLVSVYLQEYCGLESDTSGGLYGPGMAEPLSLLDGEQYIRLLEIVVAGVRHFFAHCEKLNQRISAIVSQSSIGKSFGPDCCHKAAHGAISCWATLMSSWTSSAADGNVILTYLKSFLELTDGFAALAEIHAGKSISVLRGHVQEACRTALEGLHTATMEKMADSLDSDTWMYVPVTENITRCMELIAAHAGKNVAQRTNDSSTVLMIDGMPFQTIKTVQVMLELLLQCITFCDTAPAFTPDVSQRVVGLLRTFNSRTCQLILGAGAMQVSGLKSISVKHLAISCHSVRAIAAVFPCLEVSLVRPIDSPVRRNLIAEEYKRTLQDMSVHCDEICNKIIAIMCDRLVTTTRDLIGLLAAMPSCEDCSVAPSSFMASTVKQLSILSDILGSTLSHEDSCKILVAVLQRFSAALTLAYSGGELVASGMDQQVVADLEFLVSRIETLRLDVEIIKDTVAPLKALHAQYQIAAARELELKKTADAVLPVGEPPSAEVTVQAELIMDDDGEYSEQPDDLEEGSRQELKSGPVADKM